MGVGIWGTNSLPTDFAKKSFSAMITRLMPGGAAPLFALTSMLKDETAAQFQHGYFSKTFVFPSLTLSANAAIGDTTLNVSSTANVVPGMIFRHDTTFENILVVAVVGTTQVQVQRQVGTIAAQAMSNGQNLWMVGNAYEEGSTRPNALNIAAVPQTNYTQIFRNTWAVTDSARATLVIAGDSNVAENRSDCAAFHAVDIEKALFFGQKYLGTRNNQRFSTMDGLISIVTAQAPSNVTNLGATTNWTQLEAAIDPMFNQVTDPKTGNERLLFVGGVAKRVINNICRKNSTYMVERQETGWGLRFDEIYTARGMLRLIEHPLFNSNATWAKMGVGVDLATFNVAYLGDRKTQNREFNQDGTVVDNGIDAVGGTLTTEITALVKNPAANCVLTNFTAADVG